MRQPSVFHRRANDYDAKLTPLIDVVFLLMVFFVWTSSFQIAERLLPSHLSAPAPGSSSVSAAEAPPPEADFESIVVHVVWANSRVSWRINDRPLDSLEALGQRLQQTAAIHSQLNVIVHPDPETPLGYVIEVYDLARQAGLSKVQFTATLEPTP